MSVQVCRLRDHPDKPLTSKSPSKSPKSSRGFRVEGRYPTRKPRELEGRGTQYEFFFDAAFCPLSKIWGGRDSLWQWIVR